MKDRQLEILSRASEIMSIVPEQDRRYYQEKLTREFFSTIADEQRPFILEFVEAYFADWAKQLIADALRDNAHWPDRCVAADPRGKP